MPLSSYMTPGRNQVSCVVVRKKVLWWSYIDITDDIK